MTVIFMHSYAKTLHDMSCKDYCLCTKQLLTSITLQIEAAHLGGRQQTHLNYFKGASSAINRGENAA